MAGPSDLLSSAMLGDDYYMTWGALSSDLGADAFPEISSPLSSENGAFIDSESSPDQPSSPLSANSPSSYNSPDALAMYPQQWLPHDVYSTPSSMGVPLPVPLSVPLAATDPAAYMFSGMPLPLPVAGETAAAADGDGDGGDESEHDSETDSPAGETQRKRKRARLSMDTVETDTGKSFAPSISLTRLQLLHFSSEDMDAYRKELEARRGHTLSKEEDREWKRQRRLIKNRESAQASRDKKKKHSDALQVQTDALKDENAALRARINELNAENKSFKEEIIYLKSVVESSPALSNLWDNMTVRRKSSSQPQQLSSQKAAGLALCIVLFSFGLFFNPQSSATPRLPYELAQPRQPVPDVVPKPKPGLEMRQRDLLQLFPEHAPSLDSMERMEQQLLRRHASSVETAQPEVSEASPQQPPIFGAAAGPTTNQLPLKRKASAVEQKDNSTAAQQEVAQAPYLLCSNVQEMSPSEAGNITDALANPAAITDNSSYLLDPNSPTLLALLLPAQSSVAAGNAALHYIRCQLVAMGNSAAVAGNLSAS